MIKACDSMESQAPFLFPDCPGAGELETDF